MEFQPLKKVGQPVTFKGLRGPYLVSAIIHLGITLLATLIVSFVSVVPPVIRLGITGILAGYFVFKLKGYRELSKGDLNITLKKNCRKRIMIKK